MTNFEQLYNDVIKKALVEKFGYKNPHEIPKLTKIVLNMGVGDAIMDKKKLNNAVEEMAMIAGQKPVVTEARKSIATFKLREGILTFLTRESLSTSFAFRSSTALRISNCFCIRQNVVLQSVRVGRLMPTALGGVPTRKSLCIPRH